MGSTLSQPNITKVTSQQSNSQLKYFSIQIQGWQTQMQNTSICKLNIDSTKKNGNCLFAIFDGYRGGQISHFLKQTFLSVFINTEYYIQGNYQEAFVNTFQIIDELLISQKGQNRLKQIRCENYTDNKFQNQKISDFCGCQATIVLITKTKIITANIGKIRVFLLNKKLVQLTKSHSIQQLQQKIRIQNASGNIINSRINGNIQLSRSFGLFSHKKNQKLKWNEQIITCQPYIKTTERDLSDNFLFVSCNDILQKYPKKQSQFILNNIKNTQSFQNQFYNKCLQNIIDISISQSYNNSQVQHGHKNMSAILIKFNQI